MNLGERLKRVREEKGLAQNFVAKKLGIANTTLSGYENNDRKPDPDMLKKLADFLNVSTDYLLGRTTEKDGYSPSVINEPTPPYGVHDPSRHPPKQNLPTEITAEENELLERFRKLEKKDRRTLKIIADQLDNRDSQAATMD